MSHEITTIDRVGLLGQQAWHNLGVVIQDDLTASQAAERFGLCWPVAQYPLFAKLPDGSEIEVPTHVANVRTADADGNAIRHLLGVVGADYSVCQNRELAEFTDALAQTGRVTIESCGSVRGGKRVWFLARGEAFDVGGSDKIWPYVLVSNGHDGTQAIRITPTTVRVVCSNTLHMVIPRTEGEQAESAAYVIRHSGKIADKLGQARAALAQYHEVLARNRELFQGMVTRRMDQEQAIKTFAGVYAANWEVATDEDYKTDFARAEKRQARMQKAVDAFLARYRKETEKVGIAGSAWAWMNAATGYIQHDVKARGADDGARVERRIESNLFGLNARRTLDTLASFLAV